MLRRHGGGRAGIVALVVALCASLGVAPAVAQEPPPPVSDLSASVADQRVSLEWTNPEGIEGVAVRYREGAVPPAAPSEGLAVCAEALDSCVLDPLVNGRPYSFSVFTVLGGVYSEPTSVTATPVDDDPPGTVTSLRATRGDRQVLLRWKNPSDDDFVRVLVRMVRGARPPGSPALWPLIAQGFFEQRRVQQLEPGVLHHFALFARDDDGNSSAPAVVRVRPFAQTRLSARASARVVTYRRSVRVTGRLVRTDAVGVSGQPVVLQRRAWRGSWAGVAGTVTQRTGRYRFTLRPARSAVYRIHHPRRGVFLASRSGLVRVGVRQAVTLRLSRSRVRKGATVVFSGSVRPRHPRARVVLHRRVGNRWRTVKPTSLDARSGYSFRVKMRRTGWFTYRVLRPGDRDHFPGWSPSRTVQVTAPPPPCHPSYPTVCIPPPPPDLNCDDIPHTDFTVVGSDPHGFDGDDDGVGCES